MFGRIKSEIVRGKDKIAAFSFFLIFAALAELGGAHIPALLAIGLGSIFALSKK